MSQQESALELVLKHADLVTKKQGRPETEETRHTSASGGQKGRKPETYRLIPSRFWGATSVSETEDDPEPVEDLRYQTVLFWNALPEPWPYPPAQALTALERAARIAVGAMGGPVAARYHIARVYGAGALKYDDDNWRKGYPWSWSYDALHRHLEAIRRGELVDPEMGVPHWANIWWHCATLWTFATEGLGTDDRPKKEVK